MAKLVNPLLSQDARGSVSGLQFSRNRGGNFGSRKSTSNRSQSEAVTLHRGRLKLAHSAWLALDPGLQSNWDAFAGPHQTGRNAFVGAAIRNAVVEQPAPTQNPLLGPHASMITGMEFDDDRFFPYNPGLFWDQQANQFDVVMLYLAVPAGFAVPHERKFVFTVVAEPFDFQLSWPMVWLPPRLGLRILHWDYARGRLVGEWRANVPSDEDFAFPPDLP